MRRIAWRFSAAFSRACFSFSSGFALVDCAERSGAGAGGAGEVGGGGCGSVEGGGDFDANMLDSHDICREAELYLFFGHRTAEDTVN